jgi:hypothetical protein
MTMSVLRRFLIPAAAVLALGAIGAFAIAQRATTSGSETSHFDSQIDELQSGLALTSDPTQRALLSSKLGRAEADRATELQGRGPQPGDAAAKLKFGLHAEDAKTPDVFAPRTPVAGGVLSDYASPVDYSPDFSNTNAWIKDFGDQTILAVYAGRSSSDPSVGMLKVYRQGYYASFIDPLGAFFAPGATGALRIVDGNGYILTISTSTGATLHFDASKLAFVP